MSKIYVKGNILYESSYYKYEGAGCCFNECPVDATEIPCNGIVENKPCLIINDSHPISIFNEYYASGGFSSLTRLAPFISNEYQNNFAKYHEAIKELEEIIDNIKDKNVSKIFNLLYLNVVSAFDCLVCDIILTYVCSSEDKFIKYVNCIADNKLKECLSCIDTTNPAECFSYGRFQQKTFDSIMHSSYCRAQELERITKQLFGKEMKFQNTDIIELFYHRHLLAHRNGYKKDGSNLHKTESDVKKAIITMNSFVEELETIIS